MEKESKNIKHSTRSHVGAASALSQKHDASEKLSNKEEKIDVPSPFPNCNDSLQPLAVTNLEPNNE